MDLASVASQFCAALSLGKVSAKVLALLVMLDVLSFRISYLGLYIGTHNQLV